MRNTNLAGRLREVFLNGRWIANTNYQEQITGITWQQATRQIGGLNSIAALTFHVNYYLNGLLNAFHSGKLEISDGFSFDLPEIDSETAWNKLVTEFLKNAEMFAVEIEKMDDYVLDRPFIDEKYGTTLRNIEGVIEHSYYHLGQIVLIRKLSLLRFNSLDSEH